MGCDRAVAVQDRAGARPDHTRCVTGGQHTKLHVKGLLALGMVLPGSDHLAAVFGVHRGGPTVAKALRGVQAIKRLPRRVGVGAGTVGVGQVNANGRGIRQRLEAVLEQPGLGDIANQGQGTPTLQCHVAGFETAQLAAGHMALVGQHLCLPCGVGPLDLFQHLVGRFGFHSVNQAPAASLFPGHRECRMVGVADLGKALFGVKHQPQVGAGCTQALQPARRRGRCTNGVVQAHRSLICMCAQQLAWARVHHHAQPGRPSLPEACQAAHIGVQRHVGLCPLQPEDLLQVLPTLRRGDQEGAQPVQLPGHQAVVQPLRQKFRPRASVTKQCRGVDCQQLECFHVIDEVGQRVLFEHRTPVQDQGRFGTRLRGA